MKFKDLLKKNHDEIYGENINFGGNKDAMQAKVVTKTIEEYSDYLSSEFPNISDHNEQVMNDWGELLQETATGEELLYNFEENENDEEFQPEYTESAINYIKEHGTETYYNVPFEDKEGYWHVSVLDERDIMNIVDSYSRYKF